MDIKQIKKKLDIPQFELNTAEDAKGKKTEWMRHWDNERRFAVSIHKDLLKEIKKDPSISSLGLQHEEKEAEQGAYQAYRIVKYNEAEEIL